MITFAFQGLLNNQGPNVVLDIYYQAGNAFIDGLNPYDITLVRGPFGQFKNSPFFALLMAGMSKPESQMTVVRLWVLLGMSTCIIALNRWYRLSKKKPLYIAFAYCAALLDLIVSLSANQSNALIVGLALLGIAEYRDGRYFWSGVLLMLATNLKPYPIIFLFSLALLFRPNYWLGAIISGAILFVLPAFFVGWPQNIDTHLAWFRVLINDSNGIHIMDLVATLYRAKHSTLALILRWCLIVISTPLLFLYLPLSHFVGNKINWRVWISIGLTSIVLLSPRTEVFTYVVVAPSYLLLTSWFADRNNRTLQLTGGVGATCLALAIASCRFIDPYWHVSESPFQLIRSLGAFGLWGIAVAIIVNDLVRAFRGAGNRTGGSPIVRPCKVA